MSYCSNVVYSITATSSARLKEVLSDIIARYDLYNAWDNDDNDCPDVFIYAPEAADEISSFLKNARGTSFSCKAWEFNHFYATLREDKNLKIFSEKYPDVVFEFLDIGEDNGIRKYRVCNGSISAARVYYRTGKFASDTWDFEEEGASNG